MKEADVAVTVFKRQLNLPETVAMSVALMAPTTAMVFVTPFIAQRAGYSVPLAFIVSLLSVMIIGYAFGRLGRRYAHAGSAYGITKQSLGTVGGTVAGWGLVFMYILLTGALLAGTGAFAQLTMQQVFHVNVPWGLISVIGGGVVLLLAVHDIRPSMRLLLAAEVLSMLLMVLVSVLIIGHSHVTSATALKPFTLSSKGVGGVVQALVFGLTAFLGFEGSATLGEESKDPKRMVPRAILLSALVGGLFFVFVSYSQTVGYGIGPKGVAGLSSAGAPMNYLAQHYLSTGFSALINFGAFISFFSCALAATNGAAHIVFALSRDGYVPDVLGRLDERHNTPRAAIAVVFSMGIALMGIGAWLWTAPTTVTGDLSGLGLFGALVSYGLVLFSSLKEYWAEDLKARKFHPIALQGIGLVALGYVLYGNIWPLQAPPVRYFPYIALGWFVVVTPYSLWHHRRMVASGAPSAAAYMPADLDTLISGAEQVA
jgi:amino acid transporter